MRGKIWILMGVATLLGFGGGYGVNEWRHMVKTESKNRQMVADAQKMIPFHLRNACGAEGKPANPQFCQCVKTSLETYQEGSEYATLIRLLGEGTPRAYETLRQRTSGRVSECARTHNVNMAG